MTAADDVDELYALPLSEFTASRNALAKELRAAGRRDEAASVAKLKKPSSAAWAVNQIARAKADLLDDLFTAGAELRRVHEKVMRGADPATLKPASDAERSIVLKLVKEAERVLADAGHGATQALMEKVADTFYATTTDDEVRELVRKGVLTEERQRVGFGAGGLALVPAPGDAAGETSREEADAAGREAEEPSGPTARQRARVETLRSRAEEAETEADRLAEDARRAEDEAVAARKRAERAARDAQDAEVEAERAKRAAERARASADKARARADDAAEAAGL